LPRSNAAGLATERRLKLPRICRIDSYSCSSIHRVSSFRTAAACPVPFSSSADVIIATCAPAIIDFSTSRAL